MERLEEQWERDPVLRLDFGGDNYIGHAPLGVTLNTSLLAWEALYGKGEGEDTYAARFRGVIERAHATTQRQVVVLIDEYDRPVLDALGDDALQKANRTGITRFSRMSIFSGLNNLMDISTAAAYAYLCGITGSELRRDLSGGVARLAAENGYSFEAPYAAVRARYDGLSQYFFLTDGDGEYSIPKMLEAMVAGDVEGLFRRLYAFLAGFSYEITGDAREYHFQFALALIFRGMGLQTRAEHHTGESRVDAAVETLQYVYVFEFKLNQPAADAVRQIEEKNYAAPYAAAPRGVVRVRVRFSSRTLNVEEALIRQDGADDLTLAAERGRMVKK